MGVCLWWCSVEEDDVVVLMMVRCDGGNDGVI